MLPKDWVGIIIINSINGLACAGTCLIHTGIDGTGRGGYGPHPGPSQKKFYCPSGVQPFPNTMDNAANLDNGMDNNLDNCPDCGAKYSLVGFRHRCITHTRQPQPQSNQPSGTYQYRDPVKRRAQVAEAMRRYRAKRKS